MMEGEEGTCGSPKPEVTCCLLELATRPRGSADPRAARGGCAVGSPKECRAERRWRRRGAKDPAVTGKRGILDVDACEMVGAWKWKSPCAEHGERLFAYSVRSLCGEEHCWVAAAEKGAALWKDMSAC